MLQNWRLLGAASIVFAVVAETLNIVVPERHFIQWELFIAAVVCFILAVTAWDRGNRPRGGRS